MRILAFATVAVVSTSVSADVIQVTTNNAQSSNGTSFGYASGTLSWTDVSASEGLLGLTLTNESAIGGYITGVAFDGPGTATFDLGLSSGLSSAWSGVFNTSTSPFGDRDYGASTSGDWIGGGNPNSGLAAGDTGTWVFSVIHDPGDTLSAADYLFGDNFLLRFRGFDNGDSDKVPLTGIPAVPGPASLAVLGSLAAIRRRRR